MLYSGDRGFPLLIGVTGHRDIEPQSAAELVRVVRHQLHRLVEAIRCTEVRILSGMAPGADLIVARAAVEAGVAVEAVLPMPLARYREDFDALWRQELEALLEHPLVRRIELTPAGDLGEQAGRDRSYQSLGGTLARRSSLLLAVWDGRSARLPGGTSDTVLRYLGCGDDDGTGEPVFLQAGAGVKAGGTAVFWVPVRRSSAADPADVPKACFLTGAGQNRLQMHADLPEPIARDWADLDRINGRYQQDLAAGRVPDREALLKSLPSGLYLPDRPLLEALSAGFSIADSLAIGFQRGSDRLFKLFGLLTLLMGCVFLSYEHLVVSRLLLFGYLAVLGASFVLFTTLRHKDLFSSHLACRTLAESLRVRFFLAVVDADELVSPQELLQLSGIEDFEGFGWIGTALRSVERTDSARTGTAANAAAALAAVDAAWIGDQYAYFRRKVTRFGATQQRVARLKRVLFAVMLAVIGALVVFGEELDHVRFLVPVPLKDVMMFVWGSLAVLLGVWELHQHKMATTELLWQYRNQLEHFELARMQLSCATGAAGQRRVIAGLARNSLMESYLWAIHRFHREHEPPTGA